MLILLVAGVVPVIAAILTVKYWVGQHGLLRLLWRWHSGHTLSGQLFTDATWTRPATRVLHPLGRVHSWHHRPRLHRAGIRTGTTLGVLLVAAGLMFARTLTVIILIVAAVAAIVDVSWRTWRRMQAWQHHRTWVRPLGYALTPVLGAPPARLEIEPDRSRVVVGLPEEFTGSDRDRDDVTRAVTAKVAIEAPETSWRLSGRNPQVIFTRSEPPRTDVTWQDIAADVKHAGGKELVFGLGKRDAIVTATYSESPHIAIPGPSGGGKSNLAAFLLLQELIRGSLIFNLDYKWISHLWLQDLPNVVNVHEVEDLHLALSWLGRELKRRQRAAHASAGGTGRVHGTFGPRIIVVAEELNYAMQDLKDHWADARGKDDPKRSPALTGLAGVSCAGRASDMHEFLIAQQLTAESTGVKDSTVRGNCGIKAMVNWEPKGWGMVVGQHIPMPAQTTTPGRLQLVTGASVRETQVPYLHLDREDTAGTAAVAWARQMATSGTIAQIPTGPEGLPPELWPSGTTVARKTRLAITAGGGATQGAHAGSVVPLPPNLTIREALERGLFGDRSLAAARRAVQRAQVDDTGHRDGAKTYLISDLQAVARKDRP